MESCGRLIVAHCSQRGGVYCGPAVVLGGGGSVFT